MLQHRSSKDAEAPRPAPAYFSQDQVGRKPTASNASLRGSFLRKISPTSNSIKSSVKPPDLQDNFAADYLKDLRKNRPVRPAGARPLPGRNAVSTPTVPHELPPRAESALALRPHLASSEGPERSASAMSHRRAQSSLSNIQNAGRPLARHPHNCPKNRQTSGETTATSTTNQSAGAQGETKKQYSIPYYERGQRWMEKQEAGSLRQALQEKDRLEEEARIHTQAQDEAADLVWSHQNPQDPSLPFRNPDVDFKQHLKKGSHARSQSIGPFSSLYIKKGGSGSEGSRSASEGSNTSEGGVVASENAGSIQTTRGPGSEDREGRLARKSSGFSSIKNKYGSLKSTLSGPREMIRQRSSSAKGRKTSGESASAKSVFRNPEDQIYEEPENVTTTESSTVTKDSRALASTTRNTSYGSRSMKEKLDQRSQTDPVYNRVDIYKNTPTQSRNAAYQQNEFPVKIDLLPERPPTREGKEIRSDDIRSATSMKLKDRSEKLPMPTIVSNRPGRPIVSFKSAERELRQETSSRPSTRDGPSSKPLSSVKPSLAAVNSEPIIPTISLPDAPSIRVDEAPTIRLNDAPSVPTINVPDDTPSISVWEAPSIAITPDVPVVKTDPTSRPIHSSPRPLPRPGASARPPPANRPLPTHSSTAPVKSIPHWSPAAQLRRNQAQCAACALPISGRVVGAAGQRFHPQCFNCFQCGELLECVAFYPEPDKNRAERLDRIEARLQGQPIPDEQAHHTEASDGDESLRFFCHLDFHENFSPRCRSCKTPIEGEVIVACGGEWHAGHFFCAECGDPFDEKTPFVEKDGFAWCTGCHTRKHYGKCAGCKKPILDVVMKAMGLEWHEGCFVCCQCGGGFGDGRFFVREGEGLPVCVGCEERRLKA